MSADLSGQKHHLFYAVMLLLPILFFGILEGGLRLANYGDSYPLFVPLAENEELLHQNPDVAKRYFYQVENVPRSLVDYFDAQKGDTTFRIFVQGGSSAAGYPFYYGGAFSRMLQQRLQRTFSDRKIEVINTAMAAVNSFTLRDLAADIVAYEPDAVLIYAGHNEYYGALGVGSAESLGRLPFMTNLYLRLRPLRTVQGIRAVLAQTATLFGSREAGDLPGNTLMERMVAEQSIPYASDLYQMGERQFAANLNGLLAFYKKHDVPVFIGTVASNERFRPFISEVSKPNEQAAWQQHYQTGLQAASQGDTTGAFTALRQAVALDDGAANAYYAQGRIYEAMGRYSEAHENYLASKDRDLLRFRAPEHFNVLIREAAQAHGAMVVETQQALRNASSGNIIGDNLMLEHLHPNLEGYFLIADAFYDALRAANMIGSWDNAIPTEMARRIRVITPLDSLAGMFRVQSLMANWPFQPRGTMDRTLDTLRGTTIPERLALDIFRKNKPWLVASRALANHYENTGQFSEAAHVWEAVRSEYPMLVLPYMALGNIRMKQHRFAEAIPLFATSNKMAPSPQAQRMLGTLYIQQAEHATAITYLEQAAQGEPDHVQTLYNLSGAYALTQNYTKAHETIRRLLELAPNHRDGRLLLASLPPPN